MRDIEDHFAGTKSGICENSLEMCEIRNDKATVLLTGMYKNFLKIWSISYGPKPKNEPPIFL